MSTFGMVLTDSAGNQYFVETNPGFVSLTGSNSTKYGVVSVTTTNTAQALPAFGCHSVMVIGVKGNQNPIYVGLDANVSATNYAAELDPKDQVVLDVANADMVYIYGTSGDGVSYAAV